MLRLLHAALFLAMSLWIPGHYTLIMALAVSVLVGCVQHFQSLSLGGGGNDHLLAVQPDWASFGQL